MWLGGEDGTEALEQGAASSACRWYNVRPPRYLSWFMVLITIVTGANLNQLITGGPHIVDITPRNHQEFGNQTGV